MDYDELMRRVTGAFRHAAAPADENIVCHDCEECHALETAVRGKAPDDLADEWVEQSFDQLPFFSDDAKRYYFPAFLRVAARKPDSTVALFVLYSLSDDFRMQPSGGYSKQQKQAIRDYLSFIEPYVDEFDQEHFSKAVALWSPVT
jgi:hypothetical protein